VQDNLCRLWEIEIRLPNSEVNMTNCQFGKIVRLL